MVITLDHYYTEVHCFFYSHALDLQRIPTFLTKKNLFLSPQNLTVLELLAYSVLSANNII